MTDNAQWTEEQQYALHRLTNLFDEMADNTFLITVAFNRFMRVIRKDVGLQEEFTEHVCKTFMPRLNDYVIQLYTKYVFMYITVATDGNASFLSQEEGEFMDMLRTYYTLAQRYQDNFPKLHETTNHVFTKMMLNTQGKTNE